MVSDFAGAKSFNIPVVLLRNVESVPKKIAVTYAPVLPFFGAVSWLRNDFTYLELWRQVLHFAKICTKFTGGKTGERIGIMMPNIPQAIFAEYGAMVAGAWPTPIGFTSIVTELKTKPVRKIKLTDKIKEQILDAKPAVIFAADFFYPILLQMRDDLKNTPIVFTSPGDFLPDWASRRYWIYAMFDGKYVRLPAEKNIYRLSEFYPRFVAKVPARAMFAKPDEVAHLQYTTGTEGKPKGSMLTHRNLLENVSQCLEHFKDCLVEGETVSAALPFFHAYGLTAAMNITLLGLRGRLVLVPVFSKDKAKGIADQIVDEGVTVFPGVSAMFEVLKNRLAERRGESKIKICISGAGRLDRKLKKDFEEATGAIICEGYGLSETSPVLSAATPSNQSPEVGVGFPLPHTRIKIIDPETKEEVAFGETGEIVASGPQVMKGYFEKPAETANVLNCGWFYTGDLGWLGIDGLHIADRLGDVGKVNGEKVAPSPLEEFVCSLGARRAVVIFVSDRKKGEIPVYLVAPSDGLSSDELSRRVKNRAETLWLPKEIIEVDDKIFSSWVDPLGKVVRSKAREYYKSLKDK